MLGPRQFESGHTFLYILSVVMPCVLSAPFHMLSIIGISRNFRSTSVGCFCAGGGGGQSFQLGLVFPSPWYQPVKCTRVFGIRIVR